MTNQSDDNYRQPMLDMIDDAGSLSDLRFPGEDDEPTRQPMLDKVEAPAPVIEERSNVFLAEGKDRLAVVTNVEEQSFTEAASAFETFRKEVGIDWTYSMLKAPHPTLEGQHVPNKNWIVRDDLAAEGNPKAWGPFSDGYGLTQLDAIDRLGGALIREGCRVKSVLAFDLGGSVAITAERGGRVGPRGQEIGQNVTIVDSVDGTYALRGSFHAMDPICRNTLNAAMFAIDHMKFRMAHTKNVNDKLSFLVENLQAGSGYVDQVVDKLFAYDSTNVNLDKVVTFFKKLRKVDEAEVTERARKNRLALVDRDVAVYNEAPSAAAGTFLGLAQWATFTSTHLLGSKGTREDEGKLLEYQVLGGGRKWQDNVMNQVDSWWQEEASPQLLQTVSLV